SCRRRNAFDMSVIRTAVGVNGDRRSLSWMHSCQLSLLEICSDPNIFMWNDRHQWLTGLNDLPDLDGFLADHSTNRSLNGRVFQVQSCLIESCLGKLNPRFGGLRLGFGDSHLLRSGLGALRFSLRLLELGLCLCRMSLRHVDLVLELVCRCSCGLD